MVYPKIYKLCWEEPKGTGINNCDYSDVEVLQLFIMNHEAPGKFFRLMNVEGWLVELLEKQNVFK